ncbi:MAG: lipoprotein signal peptidase [Caulobacteraceae bacterium]|nr:lipoprotein signal peptidase [Caulobacteraceae bacterium]
MKLRGKSLPLLAYGMALLIIVIDQITKWWILDVFHLPLKVSVPIAGDLFRLTFVRNIGVSFGLFRSEGAARWVLVALALAVVLALIWWTWNTTRALTAAGFSLVIGGAIGNNLIDRVRLGWVVDFLDFSHWHFKWVFNVADSAITVGVILLLLDAALNERKAPQS